jgi:hypothetical protein
VSKVKSQRLVLIDTVMNVAGTGRSTLRRLPGTLSPGLLYSEMRRVEREIRPSLLPT